LRIKNALLVLVVVTVCLLGLWLGRRHEAGANASEADPSRDQGKQADTANPPQSVGQTDGKAEYEKGFDLLQAGDTEAAIPLLESAAAKGSRDAQDQLGMIYLQWTNVKPDLDKAAHFSMLAAERGHNYAQDRLGYIYEHRSQLAKAYFWYRVCERSRLDTGATKPGFINADGTDENIQESCGASAEKLGAKLSPSTRRSVEKQVHEWLSAHK
jgi:tetratricopeptide (TPR) repeat protein